MKEKEKPCGIQLLLRVVVKDPEGKILSDTGQKPSKSFVIQFLEFVYGLFKGATTNATNIGGAEQPIIHETRECEAFLKVKAPINNSNYGIIVGTGDTAKTNVDYKLETQLTEGVGAGNITHGEQVIETTAVVGANVNLECKRSFPNNTGSTITIKEVGIYVAYIYPIISPTIFVYHCIIRDVLISTIDVPDKCALTVYYMLRTTV